MVTIGNCLRPLVYEMRLTAVKVHSSGVPKFLIEGALHTVIYAKEHRYMVSPNA